MITRGAHKLQGWLRRLFRHRVTVAEVMRERLFTALGLFTLTWLMGALGFWAIGQYYGVNDHLDLPDGTRDHNNFGFLNCMYLAAITVSTAGFGDIGMLNRVPGEGRNVVYLYFTLYVLAAYVVMVYATAQIVSYVVEGALGRYLEKRRMERELKNISDHYVVCGLGSTGRHIMSELVKVDGRAVGVDIDPANVEQAKQEFPGELFVWGDGTGDETLRTAGLTRAKGFFCALGSDKDNIIAVLTGRHLSDKVRIVARSHALQNMDKLRQVGANATISPDHIGGLRMASEMLRPSVVTFLDTMLRSTDNTTRFENVKLSPSSKAGGRTLAELDIQGQLGIVVVATVLATGKIVYNPAPNTRLSPGDSLVAIVSPDQRSDLDRLVNGSP